MQHVISIVCGANPDLAGAVLVGQKLMKMGLVSEVRPAIALGEAVEVIPVDNDYRAGIEQEFRNAGYEVLD